MEQGVEKIVSEHYADVLAYCRRHTASPEEAADACQETFLRFVRRAGAYRERGKPLAYLLTIARNVCVDLARAPERLDPRDRELIELRYAQGLRVGEVARARCEPLFRRPHDPLGARARWRFSPRRLASCGRAAGSCSQAASRSRRCSPGERRTPRASFSP